MSVTTNYTTSTNKVRKVDLYVMGEFNFGVQSVQKTNPTLGTSSGGKVCAGTTKLAQKVVQTLLSYDVLYDGDWGTALSGMLLMGNMSMINQRISQLMATSIGRVTQQLQEQETIDTPDDERLLVLVLKGVNVQRSNGSIQVFLQLATQSRTTVDIIVPIAIVP